MLLCKPTEWAIPRVKLKEHYGVWVVVMCSCRFIFDKNGALLVNDVDHGEGCVSKGGI